jgi:YD repeat-containing protein
MHNTNISIFFPLILILTIVLLPGKASAQCGAYACNVSSQHALSSLSIKNRSYNNLSTGDVSAAIQTACQDLATEESVDQYTASASGCGFDRILQTQNYYGTVGPVGQVTVSYKDGSGVYAINAAPTGLANCNDTVWAGYSVIGTDAQCYCAGSLTWDAAQQTCAPARWHDRSTCEPAMGHPIYPLTGRKQVSEAIDSWTIGGQQLVVSYDTRRFVPSASGSSPPPTAVLASGFGDLWTTSLFKALTIHQGLAGTGLSTTKGVEAWRGLGAWVDFELQSDGSFQPAAGITDQLTAINGGWLYFDRSNSSEESYDSTGRLLNISYADGHTLSYSYSDSSTSTAIAPSSGLIIAIQDELGRLLQFHYSVVGKVTRIYEIVGPDGLSIDVAYNIQGNIENFTWPDGSIRQYLYERSDFPWALTGIVDESSTRLATYGYDAQGRANETQWGNGVDHYFVSYTAPPSWVYKLTLEGGVFWRDYTWQYAQAPVLTLPNGSSSTLQVVAAGDGAPHLAGQSQAAGSGCSASSNAMTYDYNGNTTSRDDFNGNRTCSQYDATRNLPIVTLEGLPSTKACPSTLSGYISSPVDASHPERVTTSAWHPDWTSKIREATANKITTWVYNGQLDPIAGTTRSCAPVAATLADGKPIAVLCARYEQATMDPTGASGFVATVNGATRLWTYTYNQYGQMLTETTPKQSATDSMSHTTRYTYYTTTNFSGASGYTMGDRQTVTNPLGQVTTYTAYDKAGHLLSSTDANGTVTTQTYFPRGWLQTRTVTPTVGAALTTTYAYWPTGLLETVTLPDSSTLNYTYDAAHRLTDILDGAGNKVHYVLDNSGNRTNEQVSDASGNLASSIARVFDSLNRVQTVAGATH